MKCSLMYEYKPKKILTIEDLPENIMLSLESIRTFKGSNIKYLIDNKARLELIVSVLKTEGNELSTKNLWRSDYFKVADLIKDYIIDKIAINFTLNGEKVKILPYEHAMTAECFLDWYFYNTEEVEENRKIYDNINNKVYIEKEMIYIRDGDQFTVFNPKTGNL